MPILDPNELDNTIFQPILQHQFIVYADAIPSYMIKRSVAWGSMTEVIIDHINTYIKHRAKRRWNDITLSLYNPVTPSGAQKPGEGGGCSIKQTGSNRRRYKNHFPHQIVTG